MFNFRTVEETAAVWGVTPRYVQHLCQEGKIKSAVKRAGSWFIADDEPNPVKNTKADDNTLEFVGTKKKIFDNSIKLFVQKGYENVSVKDIAAAAGIRQSAVYNHFKSKQDILDTIFEFYRYYYISYRPDQNELESLLKTGHLKDIITKGFIYEFDEGILGQMASITKLIMQRITMDESATDIFRKLLMEEGIRFVEDGLNRAVELRRLAEVDSHSMAVLINCVRLYDLLCWLSNPPYETFMKMKEDEQKLYGILSTLLEDLNPPANK